MSSGGVAFWDGLKAGPYRAGRYRLSIDAITT
jgi:hypothetical protein